MQAPTLVPVEYRGKLVAVVSSRRVHTVAPWLRARELGDPELRFVVYMCLLCIEVLAGRLPGPFDSKLAERSARRALIETEPLFEHAHVFDAELADALNVPVEQVTLARLDRVSG